MSDRTETRTIIVSNLPKSTTRDEVYKFFLISGKINRIEDSIELSSFKDEAVFIIEFATSQGFETSLLLNDVEFKDSTLKVIAFNEKPGGFGNASSTNDDTVYDKPVRELQANVSPVASLPKGAHVDVGNVELKDGDEDIEQDSKPKSAILAEYLSHGYVIGEPILKKAVEYDNKNGYTDKFNKFIGDLNDKYKLEDKRKELETKVPISKYFESWQNSSVGLKVHNFYSNIVKDSKEIHQEAKRLADLKIKEKEAAETTTGTTTAEN